MRFWLLLLALLMVLIYVTSCAGFRRHSSEDDLWKGVQVIENGNKGYYQ